MSPKLDRLRRVRESQFMTQQDLAEKASLTVSTISRLESGKEEARFSTTKKLAAALGVEPGELVEDGGR